LNQYKPIFAHGLLSTGADCHHPVRSVLTKQHGSTYAQITMIRHKEFIDQLKASI